MLNLRSFTLLLILILFKISLTHLFLLMTPTGIVALLIYVDDIVSQLIEQLQTHFNTSFHMKDLSTLQYFLSFDTPLFDYHIFASTQVYLRVSHLSRSSIQ
jgi:hypothetical protein